MANSPTDARVHEAHGVRSITSPRTAMKSVRKLVSRASSGQLFNWWEQHTITPGTMVEHPKRGSGTVKLVNPANS